MQSCAHIGLLIGRIVTSSEMFVVKRNGHQQEVKFDKITNRIRVLCEGLDATYVDPVLATQKVIEGFYNGIATSEVDTLADETCAYMSHRHPDFATLAARIAVSNLHKSTSDFMSETSRILREYHDKQGRSAPLISEEVAQFIRERAKAIDAAMNYDRDFDYDYFGFKTLDSRTSCE